MSKYQNLKVLHVCSEKSWRGGEQQIAYLIEGLKSKGVSNIILCKQGSAFKNFCEENRIKFYTSAFKNNLDIKTSFQLKRICKIENPDIIHTHSSRSHSLALYAEWLGLKIPLIVSRRVVFIPKNIWKYDSRKVSLVLCVSDFIQKLLEDKLRNPEKCITVFDGIDLTKFDNRGSVNLRKELGLSSSTRIIANTSAISDEKDYFTFVDTAEIVLRRNKDIVFLIIGDGPSKERIINYVQEKGLTKNVIFTGFRLDIPLIISSFDIFFMPSKMEGFGTSLLDAMAAGVPIVSTKCGGIPEVIIDKKTGLLGQVGNAQELAKHITSILEDPSLRKSLVNEGYKHVEKFSYQNMAHATYSHYLEVIK